VGLSSGATLECEHSTRVDALVTLVNLAGDCKVRVPPAVEEHRMPCRDLPDYLQKEAGLPLGSAFIVFVYGKVPHEDTDRVIKPLQQKGYRFVDVLQPTHPVVAFCSSVRSIAKYGIASRQSISSRTVAIANPPRSLI
jgi:hypothetical protein